MASFNLEDYETVEQRIKRFYADHPEGRIHTKNLTTAADRSVSTWIVKAEVWIRMPDVEADKHGWSKQPGAYLKATGLAFEIDGTGMANKTSALENAETSAIGRALANAGYSGNKRASREEMAKVARDTTPEAPIRAWTAEAAKLSTAGDIEGLRTLYSDAVRVKVAQPVLDGIKKYANGLSGS